MMNNYDIEGWLRNLDKRVEALEARTLPLVPLGPRPADPVEDAKRVDEIVKRLKEEMDNGEM